MWRKAEYIHIISVQLDSADGYKDCMMRYTEVKDKKRHSYPRLGEEEKLLSHLTKTEETQDL